MCIEERAQLLTDRIGALAQQYERDQKFHLVTYSFCGVDARAAISL